MGRRAEIQALESALDGALAGRGGCVVISGDAGIGKSRLIRELSRLAASRQLPGGVPENRAVPLGRGADSQAVRGEAVLQLLRRLTPDGLVAAIEDLHWADPDTVAVVEYLADNAADQPLLLAVSLRPEPPSPASDLARRQRGRPGIVHLPLERLSAGEVAEMITACFPAADAGARAQVVRTA